MTPTVELLAAIRTELEERDNLIAVRDQRIRELEEALSQPSTGLTEGDVQLRVDAARQGFAQELQQANEARVAAEQNATNWQATAEQAEQRVRDALAGNGIGND